MHIRENKPLFFATDLTNFVACRHLTAAEPEVFCWGGHSDRAGPPQDRRTRQGTHSRGTRSRGTGRQGALAPYPEGLLMTGPGSSLDHAGRTINTQPVMPREVLS